MTHGLPHLLVLSRDLTFVILKGTKLATVPNPWAKNTFSSMKMADSVKLMYM